LVLATGRVCGLSRLSSAQASGSSMADVEARETAAEGAATASREGEQVKSWRRSDAKPARTVWALLGRALGRARTKERVEARQVVVGRGEVGATCGAVSGLLCHVIWLDVGRVLGGK
jgi:hypothetical protein